MVKRNTDLEKVLTKSNECTGIILATKEKHINGLQGNCPRGKLLPNPKTNPNPNPCPNRGSIFLGGTCRDAKLMN